MQNTDELFFMANYRIMCRVTDTQGVILRVGVVGRTGMFTVETIYGSIESGENTFYTSVNGKRADVRTGVSSKGRKFITTNPDNTIENNLDELQDC